MLEDLITLALLTLLQAVLGFDNLLYISLESKRAPEADRQRVRRLGIGMAIGLRIALLFILVHMIRQFRDPAFGIHALGLHGQFSIHSLIVLAGGAFILYTATKEIFHMMRLEDDPKHEVGAHSANQAIVMIVLMNLVFSFDSILSAIALTDTFWVMAAAIVFSGIGMILLADHVSSFLAKNRMYEVLGLFILFVVGVMLLTEGGHLAHMTIFGNPITPMTKTTFYFVIVVLVLVDVVQSRYHKKLMVAADTPDPS